MSPMNSVSSSIPYALITLSRKDPLFEKYLLGSFSDNQRAIPIETHDVLTDKEHVTFQILDVKSVKKPSSFILWFYTLKLKSLPLLLIPMSLVLIQIKSQAILVEGQDLIFSILSLFFIYGSFSLRNDYNDHMSGIDRILPQKESRPIQRGWFSAYQLKQKSNVLLLMGFTLGLPLLWKQGDFVLWFGVASGLTLMISSFVSYGNQYRKKMEWAVFLLLGGPVLTSGFYYILTGKWCWDSFNMGWICGGFSLYLMHLKHFSHILFYSMAGFQNSITERGFEKSKTYLIRWWGILLVTMNMYLYYSFQKTIHPSQGSSLLSHLKFYIVGLLIFFSGISFLSLLRNRGLFKRLSSPAGSTILSFSKELFLEALVLFMCWIFIFTLLNGVI